MQTKKFLFPLPLLAALTLPNALEANWFGKYSSRYQAIEACNKWKEKGDKYSESFKDGYDIKRENGQIISARPKYAWREINSRSCRHEESTKQYLGFELKTGEKTLKKNFKY